MFPIRIYLDSSDFSIMSDPRRFSADTSNTLASLREFVERGQIVCCFSGTHLSEMAPIDAVYADAAERRAVLVEELCGRNALISQDALFASEMRYAYGISDTIPSVHSPSGDWFPERVSDISPVRAIEASGIFKEAIDDLNLNRKARRFAKKSLLKRGKPRHELRAIAVDVARSGNLDDILEKYPMRPQDARVLARYAVGDATSEEAESAFLNSLRDPRWMMSWFRMHHEKLTPFIEWTRRPAKSMISAFGKLADHAEKLRILDSMLGGNLSREAFSLEKWMAIQDELLESIANGISKVMISENLQEISANTVDSMCPGISTGVRSLHSALRTVTTSTPRRPKLSDFPDALHAMYAPYVDIFRADSFMAPYITAQVRRFGTVVVPKITDLVPAINDRLRHGAA